MRKVDTDLAKRVIKELDTFGDNVVKLLSKRLDKRSR
jgi:hypothetical protein